MRLLGLLLSMPMLFLFAVFAAPLAAVAIGIVLVTIAALIFAWEAVRLIAGPSRPPRRRR